MFDDIKSQFFSTDAFAHLQEYKVYFILDW